VQVQAPLPVRRVRRPLLMRAEQVVRAGTVGAVEVEVEAVTVRRVAGAALPEPPTVPEAGAEAAREARMARPAVAAAERGSRRPAVEGPAPQAAERVLRPRPPEASRSSTKSSPSTSDGRRHRPQSAEPAPINVRRSSRSRWARA
jgi:hypothetical protein